jgi:hypothetical protein
VLLHGFGAGSGHWRTSSWAAITSGTWMRYSQYDASASQVIAGRGTAKSRWNRPISANDIVQA